MKRNTKTLIVAVSVAAIVALLFLFGILKPKDVQYRAESIYYKAKGEVDRAAGAPIRGEKDPQSAAICRRNLQLIMAAKRTVAAAKGIPGGQGVTWDDVTAELGRKKIKTPLRCPGGGSYTLMPVGTNCVCSIGANNTPSTEDDHLYRD